TVLEYEPCSAIDHVGAGDLSGVVDRGYKRPVGVRIINRSERAAVECKSMKGIRGHDVIVAGDNPGVVDTVDIGIVCTRSINGGEDAATKQKTVCHPRIVVVLSDYVPVVIDGGKSGAGSPWEVDRRVGGLGKSRSSQGKQHDAGAGELG